MWWYLQIIKNDVWSTQIKNAGQKQYLLSGLWSRLSIQARVRASQYHRTWCESEDRMVWREIEPGEASKEDEGRSVGGKQTLCFVGWLVTNWIGCNRFRAQIHFFVSLGQKWRFPLALERFYSPPPKYDSAPKLINLFSASDCQFHCSPVRRRSRDRNYSGEPRDPPLVQAKEAD